MQDTNPTIIYLVLFDFVNFLVLKLRLKQSLLKEKRH